MRAAIAGAEAVANSGTTIDVPANTYDLTHGELSITAPVTIAGLGASASNTKIVQETGSGSRVLSIFLNVVAGQVSISDVEITGGNVTRLYQLHQ